MYKLFKGTPDESHLSAVLNVTDNSVVMSTGKQLLTPLEQQKKKKKKRIA